jgi:hypothetical protein
MAKEAFLGSREEVGMVGRWRKLEEARAHSGGGNGRQQTAVFSHRSHNSGLL